MNERGGSRTAVMVVLAVLAAGLSACSGAGNAVPTAVAPAAHGNAGLPSARERVKIREFSDLPEYSGYYVPTAIASGPKRSLWVTDDIDQDFGECAVVRIATSGKLVETYYYGGLTSEGASFDDITEGPDGALWITDSYNSQILRMMTDGTFTSFPLARSPTSITVGPDKALWFTENTDGSVIGRITTKGVIETYGAQGGVEDIAAGPDGALWFTELNGNAIGRITTDGKVTQYSSGITSGSEPYSIALGPDGAMWFTELAGGRIGRITMAGKITEYSRGISPAEEPVDLTAGPDSAMWFTESDSQNSYHIEAKIGRITMNGKISEYSKNLTSNSDPTSIVRAPDGDMWFVETGADRTGRVQL